MVCYAVENNQARPARGNSGLRPICVATLVGSFLENTMKKIPLTQDKCVLVDDDDFEWLSQWKWHAYWNKGTQSYYAARNRKGSEPQGPRYISMAREVLGLKSGNMLQADHVYHDTLDNRKSSLRIVTRQQNNWNRRNPIGIHWRPDLKKYKAQITINGKSVYLGIYKKAKDARNAYLQAKKKYHFIT